MTESPRAWPLRALRILLPVTGLFLVMEYIAGLWTSAYGPANGFTSSTAFPSLSAHYGLGYALGVLAVLVLVVSFFSGQRRLIVQAAVLIVSVGVAGVAGMAFVRSAPNAPIDSVVMGIAFLFAFWAALMLVAATMRSRPSAPVRPSDPAGA